MSALDDKPFPKAPLIAAFLLVGSSLLVVGGARMGLVGSPAMTEAPRAAQVTRTEDLHFIDVPGGAVRVVAAGAPDRMIPTASGGFVRGVLRSLVRDRRARGMGSEQPFRISQWSDGAVTIQDLATGRVLNLNAFGPTNREDFVKLIAPATASAGSVA
jgi:putative photosynthetic complex assembly protein